MYQERGVDELILLDIAATPEGRGPDFKLVEELSRDLFCPLTVGGGVRSVQDVRDLLNAGADKVAVCTAVVRHNPIVREIAKVCGSQALVIAIDYLVVNDSAWTDTRPCVVTGCGKEAICNADSNDEYMPPMHPARFAQFAQEVGAGEILLTSIDRDGTGEGYDLDLIRAVSDAVSVPVIANGGCGSYEHMLQAIEAGASAVAAGAFFAWADATPREAARYLQEHGVEARV